MEKFPKIVATFLFTGDIQALTDLLLGIFVTYIMAEVDRIKSGATITTSVDLYQRPTGTWVYYPKMMIEESFTGDENFAQYGNRVTNILERELADFGCTNIVVIR